MNLNVLLKERLEIKNAAIIFNIVVFLIVPVMSFSQALEKTEVLVFGTAHLAQIKEFKTIMLNDVIKKLDSFEFDVVCIEKMPGQLLYDIKQRNNPTFNQVINGSWGKPYLTIADTLQKVLKTDLVDAQETITKILKKDNLSVSDRKVLFDNYLAITDIPSASLQYKYLLSEKFVFTEFDKYLISQIQREEMTNSEFYTLALPIAYNREHNIIEAINDFQDEALLFNYFPSFGQDCRSKSELLSSVSDQPVYKRMNNLTVRGIQSNNLSDLFIFLNSQEYKLQDKNGQWKIWFETHFESGSDRARYSLWEMRNLQITSKVLNVAARNSGKKILVIIGASHTSFIEKYLTQIEDIKVLSYE